MALRKPNTVSVQDQADNGAGAGTGRREIAERQQISNVQAPAFIRATSHVKNRLILNIQGIEGSGKDHMALTYEGGPIYVHSFDQGLDGVIQKFQDTREIYTAEYELSIQPGEGTDKEVGNAANVVWEQFKSNLLDSYASTRTGGMVIVDTGSEVWELIRLAYFGKLTQVMPHMYAKPNAEFRELVREGYDASNVVWLHKCVDEWENYTDSTGKEKGRKTGNKTYRGMNDIPFLVQGNVETWSQRRADGEGGVEFGCTVLDKYRMNPDLIGMDFNNDFNELLAMTYAGM